MSRRDYYLAKAEEAAALAERVFDRSSRATLTQAAESWRLLAELEERLAQQLPTRWPVLRKDGTTAP